jgi:hypothetical protein
MDLDQSGRGFQRVRTYLGPSLGWVDELVQPSTEIKTGGTYKIAPGDSVILVNVAAPVSIQLPDVIDWMQQPAYQPATASDRSITIKDFGGNAGNFNIVVSPFGQQFIDNIQSSMVISVSRSVVKFIPLISLKGWAVAVSTAAGGGSGGGDVFKAGNNTFTGTNIFAGPTQAPTPLAGDTSTAVATTQWVFDKNYLTAASLSGVAPIFSPTFTGDPKAPTPSPGDNDTSIATTAFVQTMFQGIPVIPPVDAEFVTWAPNGIITNERVITDSPSVTWDRTTPGQIKAVSITGGGNVSSVGTPVAGQVAQWTTSNSIQGVSVSALGAQPLDGDLTAISALTGTNTIYYRAAPDTWSPVTFAGLTFSGGVLTSTGGAPADAEYITSSPNSVLTNERTLTNTPSITWDFSTAGQAKANVVGGVTISDTAPPTPADGALWWESDTGTLFIRYTDVNSSQWVSVTGGSVGAPLNSPLFTGDPRAPTPTAGDNDTSIATTAFVAAAITAAMGSSPFSTGDAKLTLKNVADPGWIMMNDGTIGDVASGATFADNTAQALFTLLWNNIDDAWAPVFGGRGGSALTDWTAHKKLQLTKQLGRSLAIAGSGTGLTNRPIGSNDGVESISQTEAQLAPHAHSANGYYYGWYIPHLATQSGADQYAIYVFSATTASAGSGAPMNVAGPRSYWNVMIKL